MQLVWIVVLTLVAVAASKRVKVSRVFVQCPESFSKFTNSCVQICKEKCGPNAFCVYPGYCACIPFYRNVSGVCKPECEPECPNNAECVAINKCACKSGYEQKILEISSGKNCQPLCTPQCAEHSVCVSPNMCVCATGYILDVMSDKCLPYCGVCGEHQVCVSPGNCECRFGYFSVDHESCRPYCAGGCGSNQNCTAPNRCECTAGYQLLGGECTPYCPKLCPNNATCYAPGKCHSDGWVSADADCLERINLFGMRPRVACEVGWLLLIIVYGISFVFMLIVCFLCFRIYQCIVMRIIKPEVSASTADYVITYRPESRNSLCDELETEPALGPPTYDSLIRKC